jgi:hypothetical protein
MVEIRPSEKTKVVSIAQDMNIRRVKWKEANPHVTSPGNDSSADDWLNQVTGDSTWFNLEHTASTDTVYRRDTTLALASTKGQEIIIPRNMNPEAFTTIVCDNNDFSEETVSGKRTTHVASGIIIQNEDVRLREKNTVSKKHRTVKAPEINIAPYTSKESGTISLQAKTKVLTFLSKSKTIVMRKIWPELLISCTCCPESALQKVGTVCQDGQYSTPKFIKR